jgi:hypothetical protein
VTLQLQSGPTRGNADTCIYLADTGDNLEFRPFVTIYAIPEPAPPERASDTLGTTRAPAVLRLRYPDGSHDVEAVYVSPRDTALFLVSKGATRGSAIRLYRVDRSAWRTPDTTFDIVVATLVQTLDMRANSEAGRLVTAGTIRPDGRVVTLRTYTEIYLFLDDSTFVLTSEAGRSRPGTIDTVKCRLSPEQPTQ